MLMIRTPALFLMLCLASGQAQAAAAASPDELAGVWQGTLGKQRITACFNDKEARSGLAGGYYYERHLVPIALTSLNLRRFQEGIDEASPNWLLQPVVGDRMTGQWRAANGGTYLPISLQRVASSSPACFSDAFNAPIEAKYQVEIGKPKRFGNTANSYRPLSYIGEASLELSGEGAALTKINLELRAFLPLDADEKREVLTRQRERLIYQSSGAFDETDAYPVFWSPDFVTIDFYRWNYGTGRNGIWWEYRTWDLASGKQVDPWAWVGVKRDPDTGYGVPPKGAEKFETPDPERETCDGYRSEGEWYLTLESKGLHFWEVPNGEGPCERDILVPYEQAGPFLTGEGKKAVARLRARPGVSEPE